MGLFVLQRTQQQLLICLLYIQATLSTDLVEFKLLFREDYFHRFLGRRAQVLLQVAFVAQKDYRDVGVEIVP